MPPAFSFSYVETHFARAHMTPCDVVKRDQLATLRLEA